MYIYFLNGVEIATFDNYYYASDFYKVFKDFYHNVKKEEQYIADCLHGLYYCDSFSKNLHKIDIKKIMYTPECHYAHEQASFRRAPVNGVSKWRGGGGYHRRIRTLNETSANQMAIIDAENRNIVRGKRRKLPNSWDDIPRGVQHSWKEQHKGIKSWDR